MKRKLETIKITDFHPGDEYIVLDVEKSFLKRHFSSVFESPVAFFGMQDKFVYRAKKRSFGPKILKAHSITFMPETTVIFTDFEGLCELAEHYETEIFETEKEFIIAYPGILWRAAKK